MTVPGYDTNSASSLRGAYRWASRGRRQAQRAAVSRDSLEQVLGHQAGRLLLQSSSRALARATHVFAAQQFPWLPHQPRGVLEQARAGSNSTLLALVRGMAPAATYCSLNQRDSRAAATAQRCLGCSRALCERFVLFERRTNGGNFGTGQQDGAGSAGQGPLLCWTRQGCLACHTAISAHMLLRFALLSPAGDCLHGAGQLQARRTSI